MALATDAGAEAWLADLLAPRDVGADGPAGPAGRWAVLPGRDRPRVLVPLGGRRAAAAVVDRDTGLGRGRRRLAAVAFRLGLVPPGVGGRVAAGAGAHLVAYLADLAGEDPADVVAGLTIGPPRPNRKPVVQVVRRDGTTVAWAKVACSPLTTALVANEHRWLRRVAAAASSISAPDVLALAEWEGRSVLVTRPLADLPAERPFVATTEVVHAVAALAPGPHGPAAASTWADTTRRRVASAHDAAPGRGLAGLGGRLDSALGGLDWAFGAWHGDLTRWNARHTAAGLQVWDWERADEDRPVGFDLAHAAFQGAQVADGLEVAAAAARTDGVVAGALGAWGADPAGAPVLVAAYLLERWLRWHEDATVGATTTTADRHDAILVAVAARVGRTP